MTSQQSDRSRLSNRAQSQRCRSRDNSPSSTQVTIEQDEASATPKQSYRNRRNSNGDEAEIKSQKCDPYRETRRASSTETSASSVSEGSGNHGKTKHKKSSEERYNKTKTSRKLDKYKDGQTSSSSSRPREKSPRARKSQDRVPYFIDPKREEDRLRRKYRHRSRSRRRSTRRRSTSRTRRQSRTRSYSRDRRRNTHRSKSRERRRSSSYDRHRSRRRSRSSSRHHNPAMLIPGAPPFFSMVPIPYPPQFVPAPYPPRFPPPGMLRPPFPPHVVYYVPHPMPMGSGRRMNRPFRPRRNN